MAQLNFLNPGFFLSAVILLLTGAAVFYLGLQLWMLAGGLWLSSAPLLMGIAGGKQRIDETRIRAEFGQLDLVRRARAPVEATQTDS